MSDCSIESSHEFPKHGADMMKEGIHFSLTVMRVKRIAVSSFEKGGVVGQLVAAKASHSL